MAVSQEDVIANLRAIIISSKGGLKLSDVRTDYFETFGVDVPLKALGYGSLEEFFKSNPRDFSVVGNRVQAVVKSSSLHIVSLVNRQQTSSKRGRSKLSSKQARNLRKPLKKEAPSIQGRKLNIPLKYSRQTSNNDNALLSWRSPQPMQQIAAMKKTDVPKTLNLTEKQKEEKTSQVHSPMKNLEQLKGITRTVLNDKSTKESNSPLNLRNKETSKIDINSSKDSDPFEDFEDLHVSKKKPQLRLPSLKSPLKAEVNYGPDSPPNSPFARSLANNTQEEILSAKRSAQFRLDNNNINTNVQTNTNKTIDLTIDLEDGAKYEQKLKQFCLEKGMILPAYSVIIREPKNQPKCYGCKLTIGNSFQVFTYPVETHSESTARELAAKKAYNQLISIGNLPRFFFETEHVVKLRELCYQKKLPEPVFKSIECHPKNEPKYFICKVRIGEIILLSSYPVEIRDEFAARDLAAKKAFDHLLSTSKSSMSVSKNETVTLNQIYNIIESKEYGVWSNKIPILYMDKYNEELQSNWFDLVKNSPKFEINTIEKVGHIVRAKGESTLAIEEEELPVLATLKVPESNHWEVYITNAVSSAEIWCRLIGKDYSEVYDSMMTKLELQPPTINVVNPVVGGIYLVNLEESWNRVRVVEIFSDKLEASVFLIDIGIDEIVKISQLFYLQKSFFSVAPQVLLLSLNELDCLAECEELQSALFHSLLGGTFIAEIVAILDDGGNVCSANLWDTSTEDDVNVNLKLLDDVIKTIKHPALPSVGLVKEMFVSHVDENGNVYVQTSKENAQHVDYIISAKIKNSGKLVSANNKVDPKKLYVTRSSKTGLFYRAKLSKLLTSGSVIMKFIDHGYEQECAIVELFSLEETSLDLATIPSQAVQVKFANLKVFNYKVIAKIREHILEQNVLVKVIQMPLGGTPSVELFKRSQTDGTLSSISNIVINDKQLQIGDVPSRKKSFVVGLENTFSSNLSMPNIPPIGSYFNVFVTLAAHPGLFNVQPLTTQNELMELMFRLQEKCEAAFSKPLAEEDFKIGELYAVKHADNFWYRAYAHAIISPSAFTVCLCDFGDFIVVPPEKLMPLSSEFKTFPYQAIRAYLAGVMPLDKDWSAVDCVKFRELVIEKQFVSQVIEINRDANNPNYISLGLILVDTSTAEDIYIHQLLIDKKMAVLKK